MVIYLINKGANPSTQDADAKTPLHWAAEHGNEQMVKALFDTQQVDADQATTNKGHIPLHLACINGHLRLIEMLRDETKADVDLFTERTEDGTGLRNALHLAAAHENPETAREMCEILMKKGAYAGREWEAADDHAPD